MFVLAYVDYPSKPTTTMADESRFNAAISLLTEAVKSMKPVIVPQPIVYDDSSYHSIEDFFYFYERFCNATYGDDSISWLQILPEFLFGESKYIVESFDRCEQNSYETVKQQLIKICKFRDIGDDHYSRFFKTIRHNGESLMCYCIRLEVMAIKIPLLDPASCDALVRGGLLKSLAEPVFRNLNIQIGHLNLVSNETLVTIASALESQLAKTTPELPQITASANVFLPVTNDKPKAKYTKCYRCGILGHIERNCRVVLNRLRVKDPHGKLPERCGKSEDKNCRGNASKKSFETTLTESRQRNLKRSSKLFQSCRRVGRNDKVYQGSRCTSSLGNERKNKVHGSNDAEKHFVPKCYVKSPEIPNPKLTNTKGDPVIEKPIFTHPKEGGFFNCSAPIPNPCFPGNINETSLTRLTTLVMHEKNPYEQDLQINMDWDMEATDETLNDSFSSSFNLDGIFNSDSIDVREENESGYSSSDSCISVSYSEQKIESKVPIFSDGFDCSLLSFSNISYNEFPLSQNV